MTHTDSASGNWTSAADQTVHSAFFALGGIADQLNDWMATLPTYVDKFADTRPGWQDAANKVLTDGTVDKWTADGLHPTEFGYTQIAGTFTAAALVNTAPLVTADPAFMQAAAFDVNASSVSLSDGAPVTSIGGGTAPEANGPTYVASATPQGGPALDFTTTRNSRIVIPSSAGNSNLFAASGGFIVSAIKQRTPGATNFGRPYSKGLDRLSAYSTADVLATAVDYSGTDPIYSVTLAPNAWHVWGSFVAPPGSGSSQYLDTTRSVNVGAAPSPGGSQVDNTASPMVIGNSGAFDRAFDGQIARMIGLKGPSANERALAVYRVAKSCGVPLI